MTHAAVADLVRVTNAGLAFVAMAVWGFNLVRLWAVWDWHTRRVSAAITLLLAVLTYGSGAAATQDLPLYARTVLLTGALLTLVSALIWQPRNLGGPL